MMSTTGEKQLDSFLSKCLPTTEAQARLCRARMRERFPHAIEMVYDNYAALVIGYCPTEKPSEAIFSLAVFPDHVSLCFLQNGGRLPDPKKMLSGSGNTARHIKLKSDEDLDLPAVRALMEAAEKLAVKKFEKTTQGALVIRSISAKQRPRRPLAKR